MLTMQNQRQETEFLETENPRDTQREVMRGEKGQNRKWGFSRENTEATGYRSKHPVSKSKL